MSRLVDWVRRAPAVWFLAIAFAFTWSLLPLAANHLAASLVALCGPAVAAVVVTAAAPSADRLAFRTRLTHWRIPIRWYVLALALPLPISLLRSGIEFAWVGGHAEFLPFSALGLVVFVLVAGEEVGWRGFLLPRLLPRFGRWRASGIVGIIWALWHLPLFFIPGMPQHGTPFVAFVVYTVALSVVLTFLAERTNGSVLVATLFHGAVNTFGWVNPSADPEFHGWMNAVSYGLAAVLIGLMAWGVQRTTPARTHLHRV
jgi:membrane protease YdiL (CAAX protease family)